MSTIFIFILDQGIYNSNFILFIMLSVIISENDLREYDIYMEIIFIKELKVLLFEKKLERGTQRNGFFKIWLCTKLYIILEDVINNINLILFIMYSLIKVKNI